MISLIALHCHDRVRRLGWLCLWLTVKHGMGLWLTPPGRSTNVSSGAGACKMIKRVILRAIAPRLGKDRPAARMKPRIFIMGYPGTGQAGTLDDLNAEKSYRAFPAHMNTVAGNEVLMLDAASEALVAARANIRVSS